MGLTALVVGVGRFGKHYANILTDLMQDEQATAEYGIPKIDHLVLTRTDTVAAENTAKEVAQAHGLHNDQVSGQRVANRSELEELIHRLQPGFVAITARDPTRPDGDSIHAEYSRIALTSGNVLCEKPFSSTTGDGKSRQASLALADYRQHSFGLELPMAGLGQLLYRVDEVQHRLQSLDSVALYWGVRKAAGAEIIDNLAPHALPFLPPGYREGPLIDRVNDSDREITLRFGLERFETGNAGAHPKGLSSITLSYDREIGAVCLRSGESEYTIVIRRKGTLNEAYHTSQPFAQVIAQDSFSPTGQPIARIDNPLRAHIIASLKGEPLVGLQGTYALQHFLENAKAGYGTRIDCRRTLV